MCWLDHIIFAVAPLGIITAMVAAIRVGGPPWLRAVVGRARENVAAVEMELMSSTSHEVCELWNGEGIVRAMGRPEVREIIYLHGEESEPRSEVRTFGLYAVESKKFQGERRYVHGINGAVLLIGCINRKPRSYDRHLPGHCINSKNSDRYLLGHPGPIGSVKSGHRKSTADSSRGT